MLLKYVQAKELGYNPTVLFVFNMVKKSSKLESFIREFIEQSIKNIDNIFLMKSYLIDSVDYQYSILEGLSILESKSTKEDTKKSLFNLLMN